MSLLRVYDSVTADGLVGGTPHVHQACSEGYVVIGGSGAVQTLGPDGFTETSLQRGGVVWFAPGVIHRLINHDGQLEIVTLMQNSGLPEAGDAVFTFPPDVLADAARYREVAGVGSGDLSSAQVVAAVRRRRDLAVEGFGELRRSVAVDGPDALRPFYTAAQALVRDRVPAWRKRWENHSLDAARLTGKQLDRIEAGDVDYLFDATLTALAEPSAVNRPGMCGALSVYHPAAGSVVRPNSSVTSADAPGESDNSPRVDLSGRALPSAQVTTSPALTSPQSAPDPDSSTA